MPLILPETNFSAWKSIPAGFLYPQDCDDDNHIHVVCSKWSSQAEIKSVSIKDGGRNTNLGVGSAITGFKYKPFQGISDAYLQALREAAVIA